MHRYQAWVTFAILLALAPLSGLYVKQAQSVDNNTRPTTYLEDFSSLSSLDYLEGIHLDTESEQLTLQLDDHITQQESVVVAHGESLYVIWRDLRNDEGDIYLQKLNANGQRMWLEDRQINDPAFVGTVQSAPAAAMDSDGNLWVVWVDDRLGQNDLYAQYLTLLPEPVEKFSVDLPVLQSTDAISANQIGPAVATNGTDLIVVWHDNRNGVDFDIYAQRIGIDGKSQWDNDGSIHTNAVGSQSDPTIGIDDTGNVMVAWLDQRVGNGDIYYTQRSLSDANSNWSLERQANQPVYSARKPPVLVMGTDGVAQICWLSSADMGNHIYLQTIQDGIGQAALANRRITTTSVNSGMKPAATLFGDNLAIGWKAISDGRLHVDIRNVGQLEGPSKIGIVDEDGLQGTRNQSQRLSLAALNDNELFAVWVDSREGRESDIYGQKLGVDGNHAWSSARFINYSTGQIDQQNPAVAVDNEKNIVIAWHSQRGGQSNLFLQKINSDGQPVWDRQIPVIDAEIQDESLKPDLAALRNDTLVAWSDSRNDSARIYVQRFDPEGNRSWHSAQPASRIADSAVGQFNPQIAADNLVTASSTDIFIVWQESDGMTSRIALQKLNGEGALAWLEDQTVTESDTAVLQFPVLALTNEQVVIAWTSTVAGNTDLYIQTHDKIDGKLQNGPTLVNELFIGLVGLLDPPALAADPNGNTIVAWTDRRERAIYARGYDSLAMPRWDAKKLNQTPGSGSPRPDIAFVPDTDEMIVVWQGLSRGDFFVYAQRLDVNGELRWKADDPDGEEAIKVGGNESVEASLPVIAVDDSGTSSIVWREERNMNQDIYFRRLGGDGQYKDSGDIAVIDVENFYRSKGSVISSPVGETNEQIVRASLTYQGDLKNAQATFMLTNNGGTTWESIQPGKIHTFTSSGTDLRWQAHLTQTNVASLGQSPPVINNLQIAYSGIASSEIPEDVYESDDDCSSAWPIQPGGIAQERTLHPLPRTTKTGDEDWISFQTDGDKQYALLAVPTDGTSTLQMEVFHDCSDSMATRFDDIATQYGSSDEPAYLTHRFEKNTYYVKISPDRRIVLDIPYQFSIRPASSDGLAIIVAGAHDTLKTEVALSAGRVEQMLSQNGFTVAYSNNQMSDTTLASLQRAFQAQNQDMNTPLIIYLVGQLDTDGHFKLAENEFLAPGTLDLWLSNLENRGKIGPAIMVIETDRAGLFIKELSGPNRVIVTSTNESSSAESTSRGFLFPDAFWLAMRRGYNVQQSFEISRQVINNIVFPCAIEADNCEKIPMLDGNLNQAYRNGLNVSSTQLVPVIQDVYAEPAPSSSITAKVSNPNSAMHLEVHIREFITSTDHINGSPITLTLDSSGQYSGELIPKPKNGNYLITVYGWDEIVAILPKAEVRLIRPSYTYFPFISR